MKPHLLPVWFGWLSLSCWLSSGHKAASCPQWSQQDLWVIRLPNKKFLSTTHRYSNLFLLVWIVTGWGMERIFTKKSRRRRKNVASVILRNILQFTCEAQAMVPHSFQKTFFFAWNCTKTLEHQYVHIAVVLAPKHHQTFLPLQGWTLK